MRGRNKRVTVGFVGVDTAMLVIGDPCYIIDKPLGRMEWSKFLNEHVPLGSDDAPPPTHWTIPFETHPTSGINQAVVVKTGYGDGAYPVIADINHEGRVVRVVIQFEDKDGDT